MRRFKESDIKEYMAWLDGREAPLINPAFLPDFGLICEGVACGFLMRGEKNVAFLEFFASNPEVKRDVRSDAFDEIVVGLVDEAKSRGVRILLASTQHKSIRDLGKRHMFTELGEFTSLTRRI